MVANKQHSDFQPIPGCDPNKHCAHGGIVCWGCGRDHEAHNEHYCEKHYNKQNELFKEIDGVLSLSFKNKIIKCELCEKLKDISEMSIKFNGKYCYHCINCIEEIATDIINREDD